MIAGRPFRAGTSGDQDGRVCFLAIENHLYMRFSADRWLTSFVDSGSHKWSTATLSMSITEDAVYHTYMIYITKRSTFQKYENHICFILLEVYLWRRSLFNA